MFSREVQGVPRGTLAQTLHIAKQSSLQLRAGLACTHQTHQTKWKQQSQDVSATYGYSSSMTEKKWAASRLQRNYHDFDRPRGKRTYLSKRRTWTMQATITYRVFSLQRSLTIGRPHLRLSSRSRSSSPAHRASPRTSCMEENHKNIKWTIKWTNN